VVFLACRVQEVDIEGIAVMPAQLAVHVHAGFAIIDRKFVAQTQSTRACIEN